MKNKVSLGIVTFVLISFLFGCSRSSNTSFVGNYNGTLTYNGTGYADQYIVTAGSSASTINLFDVGDSVTQIGTTSGNNFTLSGSAPASGGNSVTTFSGSGSLSGNTLTVHGFASYTYNSHPAIDTFTFVGSK